MRCALDGDQRRDPLLASFDVMLCLLAMLRAACLPQKWARRFPRCAWT